MRGINEVFINDLLYGEISFFLEKVKMNPALQIEVRKKYINLYYRGGNLLRITQKRNGYQFFFDVKYCLNKGNDANLELLNLLNSNNADDYIINFNLMITEMDSWLLVHPKAEREIQHNLSISNNSVIDIEYQIKNLMRLDMLVYYEHTMFIVENKYGNGAISGKAGIAKHYNDISNVLLDDVLREELIDSIVNISYAKHKLGLLDFSLNKKDIKNVGILFVFVNYNSKSISISNEIKKVDKLFPAKALFLDKDESLLEISNAKDIFSL